MDDWDEIFKGPHWNLLANGELRIEIKNLVVVVKGFRQQIILLTTMISPLSLYCTNHAVFCWVILRNFIVRFFRFWFLILHVRSKYLVGEMFRQDDLSQFFLGNSGPLKRQNEQRTQYFRDYEKSIFYMHQYTMTSEIYSWSQISRWFRA
jgi:hypothetical protein